MENCGPVGEEGRDSCAAHMQGAFDPLSCGMCFKRLLLRCDRARENTASVMLVWGKRSERGRGHFV
jgi:hypothetical protein